MTRQEFLDNIEWKIGFENLPKLNIYIDKLEKHEFAAGIYYDGTNWICYEFGEARYRCPFYIGYSGDENGALDKLWITIHSRAHYETNKRSDIGQEILDTKKSEMISYIIEAYGICEGDALKEYLYLQQSYNEVCEFKDFVRNGETFPRKTFNWCGYTAQKLYETTRLNQLESFNYMIYLWFHKKEALSNLEAGLPNQIPYEILVK